MEKRKSILFFFSIRKTYDSGLVRNSSYQIPAKDVESAILELGRTFHREDYSLEIIEIRNSLATIYPKT